jgi:glycerol-3-phosphate dehydrogenase
LAVNCAGLHADSIARLVGDDSFSIYPRKGEFLVFDPPAGEPLERIMLPVPTTQTKGVLVFPTIDGKVIAGPTAVDLDDKRDWSVRPAARAEIVYKAAGLYPPLADAEPVFAYAGLRPAGRGVNYLIGPGRTCPRLVNVAAIRSTGLTGSLGIARRVTEIVGSLGVRLGPEAALRGGPIARGGRPWWRRTAEYRAAA